MTLLLDRVESVRRKRETGLPSFGQKLKLEREKRKITLEQISVSTKIGIRMLQALEEDNFNQLPGGIFNRGFVRAYSRFLGLDEDQTIADYLQASGDALPASTETAARGEGSGENAAHENVTRENKDKDDKVSRLEASADAPPRQVPWGVFAGVLLVVALALSFWSHRRREHTREAVRPTPATPATQVSGEVSGSDLPTTTLRTTGSPQNIASLNCLPRRNSRRVYRRHPGARGILDHDHRRRQNYLVRTFARWQRARDPRPERNHRQDRKRWRRRLSIQRKEGRYRRRIRGGQDRYFWSSRNLTDCRATAFDALSFSLSFLPFTAHPPPFNANWLPLNASSLRHQPIPLRWGGNV